MDNRDNCAHVWIFGDPPKPLPVTLSEILFQGGKNVEVLPVKKEEGEHLAQIHREGGCQWIGLKSGEEQRGQDLEAEGQCGTGLIHLVSFFVKNNTITRTMPCNLRDTSALPGLCWAGAGSGQFRRAWCACWPDRCAAPP